MAIILDGFSRTFSEYLLIPRLTKKFHLPANTSLRSPVARFKKGEDSRFFLNIPFVSASMQSVSGVDMAVALARQGGLAFIYCSQSIESQASMIAKVKSHKLSKKDGGLDSNNFDKNPDAHKSAPLELLDQKKRLAVAAGVNTHDYKNRLPALVNAGVDVISFDSSDGFSEFQRDAALWAREKYGDTIVIGGGNIVSSEAFRYLVKEAKVDFVKIGIGGGSICITREQKGIGRGQASALMDVVSERNRYFDETGIYIPICSDGGLANDTQIIIALAMGADFVMMGRYFAMTDESPAPKIMIKNKPFKPYWGEGSNRARNWQRYGEGKQSENLQFEEGIDGYVPVAGTVENVLAVTLAKLRSTMSNLGSMNLSEFTTNAILTLVSEQSIVEGGTGNIVQSEPDFDARS